MIVSHTTMSGPQSPFYKSEVFVPIRKDNHSFEERQKSLWGDMHERMERRRREWDDEVARMRTEFFRLRPDEDGRRGSRDSPMDRDAASTFGDSARDGGMFRVSFDVSQFEPEEISVRTQDQRLVVHAKHEEKKAEKSMSREFSRQIDIPSNVDPQALRCTLSRDGILQVEADVCAPGYDGVRDTASRLYAAANPLSSVSNALTAGPVVTELDGSKRFRIAVDVGADFSPHELSVKTIDRKLVVQARHEETAPGRCTSRQFNREFDLPDGVDPNSVTASMTPDGRLVLEAPISGYSQTTITPGRTAGMTRPGGITVSCKKTGP